MNSQSVPAEQIAENHNVENDDNLVPESVLTALRLPELHEIIIWFALFSETDSDFCRKTAKSLRLISKPWLTSVCNVLRKQGQPLIRVLLDHNSTTGTPLVAHENGLLLDSFLSVVQAAYVENEEIAPTFSLIVKPEFLQTNNKLYNGIRTSLLQSQKGIVKLDLYIPANGVLLYKNFLPERLSALQNLTVRLESSPLEEAPLPLSFTEKPFLEVARFLSSLLTSRTLKEFSIFAEHNQVIPDFKTISLPTSISSLNFLLFDDPAVFEVLGRNELPNLTKLALRFPEAQVNEELLFRVLENCRKIVKTLELYGTSIWISTLLPTTIRFPVMVKLQRLAVIGHNLQLAENGVSLESQLPMLHTLNLRQNEFCFRLWTKTSIFPNVTNLKLELLSNQVPDYIMQTQLISRDNMELIHKKFPNIDNLSLAFPATQCSDPGGIEGFRFLFSTKMKLICLYFMVTDCNLVENSDFFDAVLIGTTVDKMATLKTNPDSFEENGDIPSIRCLSELVLLLIQEDVSYVGSDDNRHLISDLSFIHGIFKLPSLRVLWLNGGFKPSERMNTIWEQRKAAFLSNSGDET